MFVDSDDVITKTALDELYTIAKTFDADVVHCERAMQFKEDLQKYTLWSYQTGELVKEPTLITEDFAERVKDLYNQRFIWNVWAKLIRRDFLLENEIRTITGRSEDALITFCMICSAKRYVRVPNIVYFYRVVDKPFDIQKQAHICISELQTGFDYFDKFLSKREFFQKRPDVKYLALEVWVRLRFNVLQKNYAKIPAWQLDPLIRHELESFKDTTALMAFLFGRLQVFSLQLNQQSAILQQMNAHIQKQNQVIQQLQAQIQQIKN